MQDISMLENMTVYYKGIALTIHTELGICISRRYIVNTSDYILYQWNCSTNANTVILRLHLFMQVADFNSWTNIQITQLIHKGISRTTCTKQSCKDTNLPAI